ncbi:hypothetical protein GCM10027021_38610 [Dyella kyungheensis]
MVLLAVAGDAPGGDGDSCCAETGKPSATNPAHPADQTYRHAECRIMLPHDSWFDVVLINTPRLSKHGVFAVTAQPLLRLPCQ